MELDPQKLAEFTSTTLMRFTKAQKLLQGKGQDERQMVTITLNGDLSLRSIKVSEKAMVNLNADDMSQAIANAFTNAKKQLDQRMQEMLKKYADDDGFDMLDLEAK